MALFVVLQKEGSSEEIELQWHLDERLPKFEPRLVLEVQADCDELEWIRTTFPRLPMAEKSVVNFYGDTAKMVAAALPRW